MGVCIAGQIVIHQAPPNAKGHHFITLEDEHGFFKVIARPDVYGRYRKVFRESPLLIVAGEVQWQGVVINLVTGETVPLAI
ncbi:MAG: hypothetical protein ABI700_03120 [Chloroflexota bacterium]